MNASAAHTNADPVELQKFSDLAHRWWDLNGEFRPLHEINPLRLGWINERAPLSSKRVLDVGCGGGILSEGMAHLGANVTGIDLSDEVLQAARAHAAQSGISIHYENISAETLCQRESGTFDVVTCMEMIEHVPEPASVVRACATLVRPGGQVFFSTINRNPKAYLLAVIGAEYLLRLVPRGTHDYEKFVTPSELARFARSAQLELTGLVGLHYNPVSRLYRLGEGTDVNYMMATARAS